PDIDYDFQWQVCTTSSPGSCTDIDDATEQNYTLGPVVLNNRFRVCVTATNDFPEPIKALHTPCSAMSGVTPDAPVPLPGQIQSHGAQIHDPGGDISLPNEGDTLTTSAGANGSDFSGWYFNLPAANVYFQWQRCDENGDNCADIQGATNSSYKVQA